MTPPIRLMVADVDGTLVTREKVLTERAIEAVRALHAVDILFAVTSGRPPRGMLIEPLQLQTRSPRSTAVSSSTRTCP
jgi:hydroxymethylpyrimidine pyrophosphatase-like HAD family hydrolase